MTVILMILVLLFGTYGVLTLWGALFPASRLDSSMNGRIALAVVFLFTGTAHFYQTDQMAAMLPPQLPARVPIIYATGIVELAGALGLLVPRLSRLAGICLIVFLVLVLPANIYAAVERVPMGGHAAGPVYLFARVPLQIVLIAWAYTFAVRPSGAHRAAAHSRLA